LATARDREHRRGADGIDEEIACAALARRHHGLVRLVGERADEADPERGPGCRAWAADAEERPEPQQRQHRVFGDVGDLPQRHVNGLKLAHGRRGHQPTQQGHDEPPGLLSREVGATEEEDEQQPQRGCDEPGRDHV